MSLTSSIGVKPKQKSALAVPCMYFVPEALNLSMDAIVMDKLNAPTDSVGSVLPGNKMQIQMQLTDTHH